MVVSAYKWEGSVHAGNTTYTADSHPNSTQPRQENNINVNGYKNTEDTQKQTNIY